MTQIYELDKAMSIFETVNLELFNGYKTARALLDSGGSKAIKPKGEKPVTYGLRRQRRKMLRLCLRRP